MDFSSCTFGSVLQTAAGIVSTQLPRQSWKGFLQGCEPIFEICQRGAIYLRKYIKLDVFCLSVDNVI